MQNGPFISWKNIEQVEMLPGVNRRTMGTTDGCMLCEFYLVQGAVVPLHSHSNDQVGYVISGRLEMTIQGETRVLHPGDSYEIPGGVEHGAKAVTDVVLIDAFSPPREDYRLK